jgi:MFS family permease
VATARPEGGGRLAHGDGGLTAPDRTEAPASGLFRVTLTLAMAVGFLPIFALSVLAPFLVEDLGLSGVGYGSLTTALFVGAALASVAAGRVVDRLSGRAMLLGLFGLSSVGFLVMGSADGPVVLAAGALVAGLALAVCLPATTKLIVAHVPAGRRGGHVGTAQAGTQIGSLLAGATLPSLAIAYGGRASLLASAALGVAGALLALLVMPSPPGSGPKRAAQPPVPPQRMPPLVAWLAAYGFLMNGSVTAMAVYMPLFGYEVLGFSARIAGLVAVVVGCAAVFAKVLWGRATEHAAGVARPLSLLALTGALTTGALVVSGGAGAWLLWLAALGFGLGSASWAVVTMTTVTRSIDQARSGRAAGLVMMSSFVGAAAAPPAFGVLLDATGSYAWGWSAVTGACLLAAGLMQWWGRGRRVRSSRPS